MSKTGGWGSPWVTLETPKPSPVDDPFAFWGHPPADLSPRCLYWLRQMDRGWRPNRCIERMGRDEAPWWYGVYLWEYLYVLAPRLDALRRTVVPTE